MTEKLTLEALKRELTKCWKQATSSDPTAWTRTNAAWGQCAVTALVVQDHLGGDIVRTLYTTPEGKAGSHYLNLLPDGTLLDLTASQFPRGTKFMPGLDEGADALTNATRIHILMHGIEGMSARDYMLSSQTTRMRYEHLADDVMIHTQSTARA